MSTAPLASPTVEGALHRWRFGDVSFEVNAALGARVVAFKVGEENILTGPETNALNFGSTFWTSPQTAWGWPPETEVDSEPYAVSGSGPDLVFTGRAGARTGVAVTKRFAVNPARETVTVTYEMQSERDAPQMVAPWEISRVAAGGLTFFPAGDGIFPPSNLAVAESAGIVWFDYDPLPITDHQKLFADGADGWIAHVDRRRGLLLVKTFPPVLRAAQAPGEAQIELYADPAHTYVEIEQQGAFQVLAPGERVAWTVVWRLRRLPGAILPEVGSRDLVALVRALTRTG